MSVTPLTGPEVWRLLPRDPRYLVSDHGRVRRVGGRILRDQRNTRGYRKLHLGRHHQALVHVLVCEAFHGPRPDGHEADHLDWNRHNNHATNLRWLPSTENAVRWSGRTSGGRNVWADRDDPRTEDEWWAAEQYVPLTPQEHAELAAELEAAGWTDGVAADEAWAASA